jgi:hypothetical protein
MQLSRITPEQMQSNHKESLSSQLVSLAVVDGSVREYSQRNKKILDIAGGFRQLRLICANGRSTLDAEKQNSTPAANLLAFAVMPVLWKKSQEKA